MLLIIKGQQDGAGGLKSREADKGRRDVLESQHKVRRGHHPGACHFIRSYKIAVVIGDNCRSGTRVSSRIAPTGSSALQPLSRSTASVSQAAMPGTSATTSSGPSTLMETATLTSKSSCWLSASPQVDLRKRS